MKYFAKHLLICLFLSSSALVVSGCSSKGDVKVQENEKARSIYRRAKDNMNVGDFEGSIELFGQLESRFPFSAYTQQAQLDLIYAYYKFSQPSDAINQADRFMRFNPNHEKTAYVLYMKGIIQQSDKKGLFDRWSKPKREDYNVDTLKLAYSAFAEVLERFPNSIYAEDSAQRLRFIHTTIAKSEQQIAEFYYARKQYVASANRAQHVIESYPNTQSARSALALLKKSYTKLGLDDLATKVDSIIDINQ